MASIADALIATLFAPACISCGAVLDAPTRSPVCGACWRRIGSMATRRAVPLPASSSISQARAIGPFDDVLRDVVHALKFQGRRTLAMRLQPLLRDAAGDLLRDVDAVVPVPLHPWRQWQRGYNQAELLAGTLGLPVWGVLRRRRATRSQTSLDATARRANVRGAFTLGGLLPGSSHRARRRIRGCTLVLVDDVLTTGATLEACGRVLREAGARDVRAVTAAHAELGRQPHRVIQS